MDNDVELALTPEETVDRIKTAFTDPQRLYKSDPGRPEVCNVFSLHGFFNEDRVKEIESECKSAAIGCVDCKKLLAEGVNTALAPFRDRRSELASKPGYVKEILDDGASRARTIAQQTLPEVKQRLNLL